MQVGEGTVGRLDWLDYARLVCALWVVAAHYLLTALAPMVSHGIRDYGLATEISRYGVIALFFFLMMSGMVITLVAQRQSAETFVTHRFARVYPTFFIAMTLTALISPMGPEPLRVTLPQYLANLPINAPLFGYKFVGGVYWTLVIEIIFYLAVLAVIMTGAIRRLQTVVTVWVLLQVAALPLPWRLPLLGLDYYFLAAGAVFALLYQRKNERLNLALLVLLLPLCTICLAHYIRLHHGNRIIAVGATILIFALFLFMRGRNPALPGARRIGSMTYPLYLLHFHIGLIVFFHWITEASKWALVAGTSLFVIALSFALDDVIEFRLRPFWLRLTKRTVARPFAWWDQRRTRRDTTGSHEPARQPAETQAISSA